MHLNFKYRIVALILGVVFGVFNVGLPIVIASCPMMEMTPGRVCCPMNDDATPGVVKFTNTVDTSCCATTYAAERNKTEFLQSPTAFEISKSSLAVPTNSCTLACAVQTPVSRFQFSDSSPPPTRDIPILVSSLLI